MYYITYKNILYGVKKSTRKNKKYDVYDIDIMGKPSYKFSYGDSRYSHYYDYFGEWKNKNNLDKKRRLLYRIRHKKDNLNIMSPGYMAYYYLW